MFLDDVPRRGILDLSRMRRLRWLMLAFLVAIVTSGWAYVWYEVRADRDRSIERTEQRLESGVAAFAVQLDAIFNDGISSAFSAAVELDEPQGDARQAQERVHEVLAAGLVGGAYIRAQFLVGPHGIISAERAGEASLGSAPPWLGQLQAEATSVWIGPAIAVDPSHRYVSVPVARRFSALRGGNVWVGAVFRLDASDPVQRALAFRGSAIALVSHDGRLLLRSPPVPLFAPGTVVRHLPFFAQWAARRFADGTFESPSPLDNAPSYISIRQVGELPLSVVGRVSIADAAGHSVNRAYAMIGLYVVANLVLILLATILWRMLTAVHRRSADYNALFDRSSVAIVLIDKDGPVEANATFYTLFGLPPGLAARSIAIAELAPEIQPDGQITAGIMRLRMGLALQEGPISFELMARRCSDGELFEIDVVLSCRVSAGSFYWLALIRDVSELKRTRESLRSAQERELQTRQEFSRNLLASQDQERERLAGELHDGLGQRLSLISNYAQLALAEAAQPGALERHLRGLLQITAESIGEIRGLAQRLRPIQIERLGLTEALESLVVQAARASNVAFHGQIENVDDVLKGVQATHLYRIVQEALNNIGKHANAERAEVCLERDLQCLRLRISDDGKGFDAAGPDLGVGLGLTSIEERARAMGGVLQVTSSPGQGTRLVVEIPILDENSGELAALAATEATISQLD